MGSPEFKENSLQLVGKCGVCDYTFKAKTIEEAEELCAAHIENNRKPELGKNERIHFCKYTSAQ